MFLFRAIPIRVLVLLVAVFCMGIGVGRFLLPQTALEVSPSPPFPSAIEPAITMTLPDGTRVEAPAGTPIYRKQTHTGGWGTFASEGSSKSPGISTSAEGVVGSFEGNAGTPPLPVPEGTLFPAGDGGSGGATSWKAGPTQNMLLIVFGAIVFLCGPAGFIFGKKIGIGLSLTEAGLVSAGGAVLIAMGLYPGFAPVLLIGGGGLAAVWAGVNVWKSARAAKAVSARDAIDEAAGLIVRVVDETDTGKTDTDGNPTSAGGVIKAEVRKRSKGDADLEKTIDGVIARYGL